MHRMRYPVLMWSGSVSRWQGILPVAETYRANREPYVFIVQTSRGVKSFWISPAHCTVVRVYGRPDRDGGRSYAKHPGAYGKVIRKHGSDIRF